MFRPSPLTDADIDNLAVELDAIRLDIEDSLGERDARFSVDL
jgi:NADPH-dependent stearoyl-CoA 9-desaturase